MNFQRSALMIFPVTLGVIALGIILLVMIK